MARRNAAYAKPDKQSLPAGFAPRSGSFPAQWEPEIGDTLTGKVSEFRSIETKFGESDVVTIIEDKTDLAWSVFISAGLTGRITKKDKGKRVYLRRVADRPSKKKGRKPMKSYVVGVSK